MRTPYQTIVNEYAVEAADRGESYDDAKARIESSDAIFRSYCEAAEMTSEEIEAALATK
jgi:hypothetical protein